MLITIYALDSQIVGVAVTSGRNYYANAMASLIRRIDDGHLDLSNVAAYSQRGQVPYGTVEFLDIAQAFGRGESWRRRKPTNERGQVRT